MAIAEAWDVALEAASPAQMAEALSVAMRESDIGGAPAARRIRDALPDDARAALDQLLASNGRMPSGAFERRFGEVRPMGPGRLERERPWRAPANPTEVLWYRGFIFRAFDRAARSPAEWFFVPAELGEALMARAQDTPEARPAIPATAEGAPDSNLLDDITSLLIHIQTADARARRDGEWTQDTRRLASRWLRDPDGLSDGRPGGRFVFLAGLIAAMGWSRNQDGRLRLTPQPVADWLQLPAARQREALFAAWRDNAEWNDLWRVDGLSFEMTHAWSNAPLRERRDALRALEGASGVAGPTGWRGLVRGFRRADGGDWASLRDSLAAASAVIGAIKRATPDFLRPDGRYDTWHIRDALSGDFLNGFENWDRIEGAYLLALLSGPLRWLESDRLDEAPQPAPQPPLRLGKGSEVIALPGARFARFQLARIAQFVEPRDDGGWMCRLTPASLGAAAHQGISLQRAIEFLEQGTGAPLPAALAKAVARASERGPEARAERGALLRARDPAVLDALLRFEAPRRALLERLSPTVALIRAGDVRDVAAAIAEQGMLIDVEH